MPGASGARCDELLGILHMAKDLCFEGGRGIGAYPDDWLNEGHRADSLRDPHLLFQCIGPCYSNRDVLSLRSEPHGLGNVDDSSLGVPEKGHCHMPTRRKGGAEGVEGRLTA